MDKERQQDFSGRLLANTLSSFVACFLRLFVQSLSLTIGIDSLSIDRCCIDSSSMGCLICTGFLAITKRHSRMLMGGSRFLD
jgi:hypothetical protein